MEILSRTSFAYGSGITVEPTRHELVSMQAGERGRFRKGDAEGERGMTSLRLFETGGALIAEDATSHPIETRPVRYRRSRWAYDASVVLHAVAVILVVSLARHRTQPPLPARPIQNASVLVRPGVDKSGQRRPSRTRRSTHVPAAIAGAVAATLVPAAPRDSRVADTSSIADEEAPTGAFDPPIPDVHASLQGSRGEPSEAGLGSAIVNVRGSSTADSMPRGLGDGSIRDVRNGGSLFGVRPGFEGASAGGGATPPRIQGPLPIPDYPAEARTHRLQGVVVLEVVLDTFGKAHVRGVLSRILGFGIEEAARDAAERLKFTPARQGGRSVDAIVHVRVTFTLTDGGAAVAGGV